MLCNFQRLFLTRSKQKSFKLVVYTSRWARLQLPPFPMDFKQTGPDTATNLNSPTCAIPVARDFTRISRSKCCKSCYVKSGHALQHTWENVRHANMESRKHKQIYCFFVDNIGNKNGGSFDRRAVWSSRKVFVCFWQRVLNHLHPHRDPRGKKGRGGHPIHEYHLSSKPFASTGGIRRANLRQPINGELPA